MLAYFLTALIDFFVAGLVLAKSRSRAAVAFSLLAVSGGVWSLELFFLTYVKDLDLLTPLFQITRPGMFMIAPLLLCFMVLTTRTRLTGGIIALMALPFAVGIAISVVNVFALPTDLTPTETRYSPIPDLVTSIHRWNFVFAGVASVALGIKAYRRAVFAEKQRLRWITVGVGVGTLLGVLSFEFSKLIAGTAGNLAVLSCFAYATARHRLSSIRSVFDNGLLKLAAATGLLSVFFLVGEANERLSPNQPENMVIQVVILLGILEIYPRFTRFLAELRNKYQLGRHYNFDFARSWVLTALKNCSSVDAFGKLCDEVFRRLVGVRGYSIHLNSRFTGGPTGGPCRAFDPAAGTAAIGPQAPVSALEGSIFSRRPNDIAETQFYDDAAPALREDLERLGASAVVPIRIGQETVGFVLLGAPGKQEQFSYDDVRLLNWFGSEVGPVLETLIALLKLETSLDEAEKTLSVVSRLNEYNHDVKTPFSNIEALLLAGDAFSAEERQARILEQVRKGHALVATMTGMLKGNHHKRKGPVNLNTVIERVVGSFPTKAGTVSMSLDPLPPLVGYEEELEILISNLLSNAFSAQDKDDHMVRIWTWYDAASRRIGCCVQDNGCGIAKERIATLWQAPETTRRAENGTGLGLGVIRRITETHAGTVVVSSELGTGTEFTLSLPVEGASAQRATGSIPRVGAG
ncbi:MAG: hypothetical protein EP335_00260 [Alphaproteobacteria bacterium]|nr:MAG: hypothetical protein EP335_00260 [Alphaproteobacteria bacterium]